MALDIPVPKIVPDVGPGGPIFDVYNTLTKAALEKRKRELENQYYGPTAEANALSKAAYAKYAGPQAIAAFLQSPAASNLTREQYQQLAGQFQQGLSNAGNINVPHAQEEGGGIANTLLKLALHKMFGQQQPQQQQSGNALLQPPGGSNAPGEFGAQNKMSDEEVTNFVNSLPTSPGQSMPQMPSQRRAPGSTIGRLAEGEGVPGAMGGETPQAIYGAQQKALDTLATGEAAAQNDMWKQIHTNAATAAMGAQDNINLLDKFNDAYGRLSKWERGPLAGRAPAVSTAAQDTDATANAIADAVARAQQKGHITVTDRQTYTSMKPGRHMTPEAQKNQVEFIKGMNERIGEEPAFYIKAQELGLNPQQANAVWTYFIKNKPFYDAKKHKVIDKNIDAWEEFLTPKKIMEALNPKQRQKMQAQQANENQSSNRIMVRSPDGKLGSIRESDWNEAQKAGYKRI